MKKMSIKHRKILVISNKEENILDGLFESLFKMELLAENELEMATGLTYLGRVVRDTEIEFDL